MAEVERPWTEDQFQSDAVPKKQIIEFLQEKASSEVICCRICYKHSLVPYQEKIKWKSTKSCKRF